MAFWHVIRGFNCVISGQPLFFVMCVSALKFLMFLFTSLSRLNTKCSPETSWAVLFWIWGFLVSFLPDQKHQDIKLLGTELFFQGALPSLVRSWNISRSALLWWEDFEAEA